MSDPLWSMFIIKLIYDENVSQCDAGRKRAPALTFVCRTCPSYRTSDRLEARRHLTSVHPLWEQAVRSRDASLKQQVSSAELSPVPNSRTRSPKSPLADRLRKRVVINFHTADCAQIAQLPNQSPGRSDDEDSAGEDVTAIALPVDCDEVNCAPGVVSVTRKSYITCPMCGVRTKDPAALQRHLKRRHPQKLSEVSEDFSANEGSIDLQAAAIGEFDDCDKSDGNRASETSQDFVCYDCRQPFVTKSDLMSHSKCHRKYTCALCKKQVPCMSSLRNHCVAAHDILLDLVEMPRRRRCANTTNASESDPDRFSEASSLLVGSEERSANRRCPRSRGGRRGRPRLGAMRSDTAPPVVVMRTRRFSTLRRRRRKQGRPRTGSALRRNVCSPSPLRFNPKPEPGSDTRYRSILPKPSDTPATTARSPYPHISGRWKGNRRTGRTRQTVRRVDGSLKPLLCESFPASELFPSSKGGHDNNGNHGVFPCAIAHPTGPVGLALTGSDRTVLSAPERGGGFRNGSAPLVLTQDPQSAADPAGASWALGAVSCCTELSTSGQLSSQIMLPNSAIDCHGNGAGPLLPSSAAGDTPAQSYSTPAPVNQCYCCCYYYYYYACPPAGEQSQAAGQSAVPGLPCKLVEATELQAMGGQPQQFVCMPCAPAVASAYLPDFFRQVGDVAVEAVGGNAGYLDDPSQDMMNYNANNMNDLSNGDLEDKQNDENVEVIDLDRSPFRKAGVTSTDANMASLVSPQETVE